MAFDIADVLRFKDTQSVDAIFSSILEKNLFKDATFQNGITFTNKFQERAGQIFVRKLGKPSVTERDPADEGSLDFAHTLTADTLIPIVVDTEISVSEKIYDGIEDSRLTPRRLEAFETAVLTHNERFQVRAAAKLIDGAKSSANTAKSTADTILKNIVADRKAIRDVGGNPDVLVVSTRIYSVLLNKFSGNEFLPNTNEDTRRTGLVGWLYGFKVFESNTFTDRGAAAAAGQPPNTEYILYDHDGYSIITHLIASRVEPAGKDFVGALAQVQTLNAFKVPNPDLVIRKTITA